MSDVFISYAHADYAHAEALAGALRQEQFSVWWDPNIPIGGNWRTEIEKALQLARCVIVLWSSNSVESSWVSEEADVAKERGILCPVLIDHATLPIGFRGLQCALLSDWDGDRDNGEFRKLCDAVRAKLRKIPPIDSAPPEPAGRSPLTLEPAPKVLLPIDRGRKPRSADASGRRLALLVGASEFDDHWLGGLVTPASDLEALRRVLEDPEIGRFTVLPSLLNSTDAQIRRRIDEFFSSAYADDLLLLYYSGHGVLDEQGHLYLAGKDTVREALASTAVSAAFVSERMDRCVARHQVLVLDCCHSGAFAKGAKAALAVSVGTSGAFEGTSQGRTVLTATDSTQYAWSGDEVIGTASQSTFTRHLVEGLETGNADLDGDGRITLDDWYGYVHDCVRRETPKQTPRMFKIRRPGEVVIGWNPKIRPQPRRVDTTAHPEEEAPGTIEELSLPPEVRPKKPSEIRVRFSPGTSFVRIVFRYDNTRLEVTGKDQVKDHPGEFEHLFAPISPRVTRYTLKAKDIEKDDVDDIDINLFDRDGQLIGMPLSEKVKVRRASWWRSLEAKITSSVLLALLGLVGTAWNKLAPAIMAPPAPLSRGINADFTEIDNYFSIMPKARYGLSPWTHNLVGKMALQLDGELQVRLADRWFGRRFFSPSYSVGNYSLTMTFQFVKGDELRLLARAEPDRAGWYRRGYMFVFHLAPNALPEWNRAGWKELWFGTTELRPRTKKEPNGYDSITWIKPDAVDPSVEGLDMPLLPTDWYTLHVRDRGSDFEFSLQVGSDIKTGPDGNCRWDLNQWHTFKVSGRHENQGNVGIYLAKDQSILLNGWYLNPEDKKFWEKPPKEAAACLETNPNGGAGAVHN